MPGLAFLNHAPWHAAFRSSDDDGDDDRGDVQNPTATAANQ